MPQASCLTLSEMETQLGNLYEDGLVDKYIGTQVLGRSSFAVFSGKMGPERIAIKVIPYKHYCLPRDRVFQEMHALQKCSGGSNIVKFIGWQEDVDEGYIYIGMQRYEETLSTWITDDRVRSSHERFNMLTGIITGISFIHLKGLIHNNIKPGSIGVIRGEPVIADFGSATLPGEPFFGTDGYICPESYKVVPGSTTKRPIADEKTDAYAFGVTIYQLYSGNLRRPTDPYGFDLSRNANTVQSILQEILIPRENRLTVREILTEFISTSTPPSPASEAELRPSLSLNPLAGGALNSPVNTADSPSPVSSLPIPFSEGWTSRFTGPSKLKRFPLIQQFWGEHFGDNDSSVPINQFIQDTCLSNMISRETIALLRNDSPDLQVFHKLLAQYGGSSSTISPATFGLLLLDYPDTEKDTMESALKKIFAQIKGEGEISSLAVSSSMPSGTAQHRQTVHEISITTIVPRE